MSYTEIDSERRKVLILRKMIRDMEAAIKEATDYVDAMEDQLFDEWELETIRRTAC